MLDVRNLTVSFGSAAPVVRDVSFTIGAGECLALVGESGSGKSVTARTILGLAGARAHVTAERLVVTSEGAQRDLHRLSEREWRHVRGLEIGLISQDALVALDPLRTVGREVGDALRVHGIGSRERRNERVVAALDDAGVPEPEMRSRQYAWQLSGGLRQRSLIASALVARPRVLIADEPTTALDASVRARILELLRRERERGTSILFISHDLSSVSRLAQRVAVMRAGEIVEQGASDDVLGSPQSDYTQSLLAATPRGKPRGSQLAPRANATFVLEGKAKHPPARETPVHETPAQKTGTPHEPSSQHPLLVVHEVSKTFTTRDATIAAVTGASLELHRGETLGIIGESGSGKTTLARIILGLERADTGSVTLFGEPWSGKRERDRRSQRPLLGAVYQDALSSFDPRWRVGRILADALTGGRQRRVDRERLAALLESVELPIDVAQRAPRSLSGGQRQRVAIARALASNPHILVCDEPVSALDVSTQAVILDLLDSLQRERGLSMLFISHDLDVVRHMSDRVAVMRTGVIVESGETEAVFNAPQATYTHELLAAGTRLADAALQGDPLPDTGAESEPVG